MKKVRDIPGNCASRNVPPEVPKPGGAASLGVSQDAKPNKGVTTERQDTRGQRFDGVTETTPGVPPTTSSPAGAGMSRKESHRGVVGGEDSLRTIDRALEEALGDGGKGAMNGEWNHGGYGGASSAVTLLGPVGS